MDYDAEAAIREIQQHVVTTNNAGVRLIKEGEFDAAIKLLREATDEMPGNKIGLLNVHHRVSLLYGQGLVIRRLEPGTDISFLITQSPAKVTAALESDIA